MNAVLGDTLLFRIRGSLSAIVFVSFAIVSAGAFAGGLLGDIIEGVCGNCGAGKALDKVHKDLGKPLDVPGRVLRETVVESAGPLLGQAIRHSRDDARSAGVRPIPPRVKARLSQYFPAQLLDGVTYRVGRGHELSVQANSIRFGDARAVALIDTIVFASQRDAEDDKLWAHEIAHVQQYRNWGLTNFGKRYVRDYRAVENDANRTQRLYVARLRQLDRERFSAQRPRLRAPNSSRPALQSNQPVLYGVPIKKTNETISAHYLHGTWTINLDQAFAPGYGTGSFTGEVTFGANGQLSSWGDYQISEFSQEFRSVMGGSRVPFPFAVSLASAGSYRIAETGSNVLVLNELTTKSFADKHDLGTSLSDSFNTRWDVKVIDRNTFLRSGITYRRKR